MDQRPSQGGRGSASGGVCAPHRRAFTVLASNPDQPKAQTVSGPISALLKPTANLPKEIGTSNFMNHSRKKKSPEKQTEFEQKAFHLLTSPHPPTEKRLSQALIFQQKHRAVSLKLKAAESAEQEEGEGTFLTVNFLVVAAARLKQLHCSPRGSSVTP